MHVIEFNPTRLVEARKRRGLRRERAAVTVDRSAGTITLWEHGRIRPNAEQLATLANLYGCDVDEFYDVTSDGEDAA